MSVSEPHLQRLQLIDQILHLPPGQLDEVARFVGSLATRPPVGPPPLPAAGDSSPARKLDWPHAPLHRLSEQGTYIVTGATLHKEHYFSGAERLDYLQAELLAQAKQAGWHLEAWAVFSNHYHFVGHSRKGAALLSELIRELHRTTAVHINRLDQASDRQVLFQFWDTRLTYEASYLARLKYVHHNAVRHGLVPVANQYRWCSAGWFEQTARPAQVATIYRQKIDRVKIEDDFEPV